jgi:hypothetical protein
MAENKTVAGATVEPASTAAFVGATSLVGAAAGISAFTLFGKTALEGTVFGLQKYQVVLSGSYFMFFIAAAIPGRLDQKIGM